MRCETVAEALMWLPCLRRVCVCTDVRAYYCLRAVWTRDKQTCPQATSDIKLFSFEESLLSPVKGNQ
jgi:hypothetical protein